MEDEGGVSVGRQRKGRRFIVQADEGVAVEGQVKNVVDDAGVGALVEGQVALLPEVVDCFIHPTTAQTITVISSSHALIVI